MHPDLMREMMSQRTRELRAEARSAGLARTLRKKVRAQRAHTAHTAGMGRRAGISLADGAATGPGSAPGLDGAAVRYGAAAGSGTPGRLGLTAREFEVLRLVASGAAITTVPDVLLPGLPPDVRTVRITGGSAERRRLVLVRAPGPTEPAVEDVADALRNAARAGSG